MNIIQPLIFTNEVPDSTISSTTTEEQRNHNFTLIQGNQSQNNTNASGNYIPRFYNNDLYNPEIPLDTPVNASPVMINTPSNITISEATMSGLIIDTIRKTTEAGIRTSENQAKNDDKLRTKRESKEIDEETENRKDVKHPVIFKSNTGELFYYFDNGKKRSSPALLLDIDSFNSVIYSATDLNGITTQILTFNWRPCTTSYEGRSIYLHLEDGISATKIINLLTANGLKLLTSGRKQKELAETLLNYCINNSQIVELPYAYGWNLLTDGTWYFAHENELTMFLIIKNHFIRRY